MANPARPAFLKLVHSVDDVPMAAEQTTPAVNAQGLFFPSSSANTLIFADWEKTSLADLIDILELSKPKVIFDLRITPRFDLETLNRKRFFGLLEQSGCQYIDLLGRLEISDVRSASANPVLVGRQVGFIIGALSIPHQGPFVFLHDDAFFDDGYIHAFATSLPAIGLPWQVFRPSLSGEKPRPANATVGQPAIEDAAPLVRRAIFISHATPEDNDFVLWLASKLTTAGYEVWSDITQLQGGDSFWGDIEAAIRNRAAKVLFIYSDTAKRKVGTRKEIYLALKVGEHQRLSRFVIPMRIDDAAFDETFIELIDIQAIDCRNDWLTGLNSLLLLLERDGVPRQPNFEANQFFGLVGKSGSPTFTVAPIEETMISTWLEIEKFPTQVNFFSVAGLMPDELRDVASRLNVPAFSYFALLATTATQERTAAALEELGFGHTRLSLRAAVPWNAFCSASWADLPRASFADARRSVSLLLNRAIARVLNNSGASTGSLANERPFWFFANGRFPKNEVRFADHRGATIRRQLVGFSNKRKVFWHFGVQIRCGLMANNTYLLVSPHVTFSANGTELLASKVQLHSLRRSFCRSWWNKRWRDLLQGFLAAVSSGEQSISVDIGSGDPMIVSAVFKKFASPISPIASVAMEANQDVEDTIEDVWDAEEGGFDELTDDDLGDSGGSN